MSARDCMRSQPGEGGKREEDEVEEQIGEVADIQRSPIGRRPAADPMRRETVWMRLGGGFFSISIITSAKKTLSNC